ncbi:hypothetical protein H072_10299 [Dactylellina haptotyla CBS 200.50]|uniref:Uncharacterized protein n=1 Tax=Dactylellina haptotyla (strain CBS 200.50) TaxID=1284197 RepID=S8BLW1_DACHA|nr:hypothetical protein H072_10299 [Dactylellina haptotyla CBS 200.50]
MSTNVRIDDLSTYNQPVQQIDGFLYTNRSLICIIHFFDVASPGSAMTADAALQYLISQLPDAFANNQIALARADLDRSGSLSRLYNAPFWTSTIAVFYGYNGEQKNIDANMKRPRDEVNMNLLNTVNGYLDRISATQSMASLCPGWIPIPTDGSVEVYTLTVTETVTVTDPGSGGASETGAQRRSVYPRRQVRSPPNMIAPRRARWWYGR